MTLEEMQSKRPSDEAVDRMVTLVKDMANRADTDSKSWLDEANFIVTLLPQYVDPDLAAAREIVALDYEAGNVLDETHRKNWSDMCRRGYYDNGKLIKYAFAGIKHGRKEASK
jgi:hypothetical protein